MAKTRAKKIGMMSRLALTSILCVLALGAYQGKTDDPMKDRPILKIAVFMDGRFTVDGAPSSIKELSESLRKLGERKGVVWYYREAGQREPPPIALEVLKQVVDARLPIRLSSKPDYSDSVVPK